MSFIPKNPLTLPKIDYTPSTPPSTRGLFAKKDGFYEVDENGNSSKLYSLENLNISKKYYGDIGIIPSPEEWFNYETNEDNTTVTITGFSEIWFNLVDSNKHDIVIPYEINDCIVNSIGHSAFDAVTIDIAINSIIFPNTIKKIEGSCFIGHMYLSQIKFTDHGLETIGDSAFSDNTSLEYIKIPNSVSNIGDSAFTWCTNLAPINIPDSVISIGENAFLGCKKMTSIKIPDSVSDIGVNAFDPNTTIICSQGSYAETYAKENGYEYIYDLIKEIKVDAVLDSESENPVQNKHIAQHISELMSADANLALLVNNLNNEVENAEVFVVEAIVDNENNTVSANANYFDVENAYSQGKNIILKMSQTNSTGVVIGFLNGKTENDSVVWSAVLGSTNMQAELNKDGWTIEEWNFMERFETVKDVDIEANVLKVTFGDNVVKDVILPTGNGGNVIVDDALSSKSENPVQNKVVTNWLTGLNNHISNLDKEKSPVEHSHKIADIEDYVVDEVLDSTSTNPVQNKHIAFHISELMNADSELTLRIDNEIGSIEEKISKKLDSDKVDATLDISSTNPVQNKVVANELNEKISDAAIMADRYLVLYKLDGTNIELEVATPTYVDNQIGSIETALDNIIAIQNTLIGGDSV